MWTYSDELIVQTTLCLSSSEVLERRARQNDDDYFEWLAKQEWEREEYYREIALRHRLDLAIELVADYEAEVLIIRDDWLPNNETIKANLDSDLPGL